jgi:hypothetical protein
VWVTTREAARRLGLSLEQVRHCCESGELDGRRTLAGRWRVKLPPLAEKEVRGVDDGEQAHGGESARGVGTDPAS